jgi:hypothetical protein
MKAYIRLFGKRKLEIILYKDRKSVQFWTCAHAKLKPGMSGAPVMWGKRVIGVVLGYCIKNEK